MQRFFDWFSLKLINIGVEEGLTHLQKRKIRLLNVFIWSLVFVLTAYIILNLFYLRFHLIAFDVMGIVTVGVPSLIFQRRRKYDLARGYFFSLLLLFITIFSIRILEEHRHPENILIAVSIAPLLLFRKKLRFIFYLLFVICFFIVKVYEQYVDVGAIFAATFYVNYTIAFILLYIFTNYFINDLEHYESELRLVNQTKDKFFRIISHDLKDPFNSIMGLSEFLLRNAREGNHEKTLHFAKLINNSSTNAYRLTKNLLDWSRSQAGHLKFEPTEVLVKDLVNDAINSSTNICQSKKIETIFKIEENLMAYCDVNMMQTVIRNLYTNAVKFTKKGGEVIIKSDIDNGYLKIQIEDNGVGMPTENTERLFNQDKYFSTKGTAKEEGTGLGLILCKEFVDLHKGTISVESEVDKGTLFTIQLPTIK